jgi:hypothetical protein
VRSRTFAPSVALIALGLVAAGIPMSAEDLSVAVTPQTTLNSFRTFAIRDATVHSDRPEFDNPLFVKNLTGTIREALTSKGLRESSRGADLIVDYVFTSEDGTATGSRPRNPRRSARGTLIIDLNAPASAQLVWRGTYRDEQPTGSDLRTGVLKGAKALLDKYPRLRQP